MSPPDGPAGAGSRFPVALAALLGAALMINYVDRGTISTAAPLIEKELGLTPSQLGWILSAFFWAYVPAQPLMGYLADRFGAARVLAGGFTLWSAATVFAGASAGVRMLVGARLVMGAGESVTYPSALALLAQGVTDRHRARATSLLQLGGMIGPALGTTVSVLIMARYGWRAMFISLGLASLLWLIPWSGQLQRAARGHVLGARHGPTYRDILSQRGLWGTMLGNFCSNYAFYFVFSSLPLYLVHERGLSLLSMGYLTTGFYLADSVSVLATGWWLDAWTRRGASANKAYKTALIVSAAGVGACLLGSGSAPLGAAAALLVAAGVMDGMNAPSVCSLVQRFAGPLATGRWMGVQNAVSNVAGIVAPVAAGYLVEATGHYTAALYMAGVIALIGMFAWVVIVPPVEPVDWSLAALTNKSAPVPDPR
jgi:MFS transporter, ACS family, D-galactonate transporter